MCWFTYPPSKCIAAFLWERFNFNEVTILWFYSMTLCFGVDVALPASRQLPLIRLPFYFQKSLSSRQ